MADIITHITTPATELSLATTDEVKMLIGIPLTETTNDTQLSFMIEVASATIMRAMNRVLAQETLTEEWRDVWDGRLFLTHWPVVDTDITSVTQGDGSSLTLGVEFEVEETSGKIERIDGFGWIFPVTVSYTGGYVLPTDAPLPLKQCVAILVREMIIEATRQSMQGIRSITHKEARVMFFDYVKPQWVRGVINLGTGSPTVDAMLMHYVRLWV